MGGAQAELGPRVRCGSKQHRLCRRCLLPRPAGGACPRAAPPAGQRLRVRQLRAGAPPAAVHCRAWTGVRTGGRARRCLNCRGGEGAADVAQGETLASVIKGGRWTLQCTPGWPRPTSPSGCIDCSTRSRTAVPLSVTRTLRRKWGRNRRAPPSAPPSSACAASAPGSTTSRASQTTNTNTSCSAAGGARRAEQGAPPTAQGRGGRRCAARRGSLRRAGGRRGRAWSLGCLTTPSSSAVSSSWGKFSVASTPCTKLLKLSAVPSPNQRSNSAAMPCRSKGNAAAGARHRVQARAACTLALGRRGGGWAQGALHSALQMLRASAGTWGRSACSSAAASSSQAAASAWLPRSVRRLACRQM